FGGTFGLAYTAVDTLIRMDNQKVLAEAIKPDTEPGLENWLKINTEYSEKWPNITMKRDPLPDAKEWDGKPNKFEQHFSAKPGEGD
ncbi:MAG: DUF3470 domain-containing protein, partial [Pseudomonadota bacterium]